MRKPKTKCSDSGCPLPPNPYGAPTQAGIFMLSDKMGVLIANIEIPEEKVPTFLKEKFGDTFRVFKDCVHKYGGYPPLWLYFFEVIIDDSIL